MPKRSQELYKEASEYLVGGVNSPIRAFRSVNGNPLFIKRGKGSKISCADGKEYIDYVGSYGALILGHAPESVVKVVQKAVVKGSSYGAPTEGETALAKEICGAFPSIQKVRFVSSGTEAAMGAIKLSCQFTKREKIINFKGCYHGWSPYQSITLPYNDLEAAKEVIKERHKEIAAIIVEPVAGNMGVVVPKREFLAGLRKLATKYGIVLIFDEVITGFRLAYGGAQEYFGVSADLTCLGKVIGGGFPIGAFGGRNEIMDNLAPLGSVYQAGTLSGNPIAVTAGIETLKKLKSKEVYGELEKKSRELCDGIGRKSSRIGSMFSFRFDSPEEFRTFFWQALKNGIYFAPSKDEANFVSLAHTQKDIKETIRRFLK
jgi:glutamate-1-semialdehyde 2,1-aminomutase